MKRSEEELGIYAVLKSNFILLILQYSGTPLISIPEIRNQKTGHPKYHGMYPDYTHVLYINIFIPTSNSLAILKSSVASSESGPAAGEPL